jgi:hypothetical protein
MSVKAVASENVSCMASPEVCAKLGSHGSTRPSEFPVAATVAAAVGTRGVVSCFGLGGDFEAEVVEDEFDLSYQQMSIVSK